MAELDYYVKDCMQQSQDEVSCSLSSSIYYMEVFGYFVVFMTITGNSFHAWLVKPKCASYENINNTSYVDIPLNMVEMF